MEFPDLGKQCSAKACQALDFLPLECTFCHQIFCKEHLEVSSHKCEEVVDNIVGEKKISENYNCSAEKCKTNDAVEMKCIRCDKHFCLEHRHHGCLDAPPTLSKREKQRLPKEQFKKAKAETDAMVQEKLKKAKNRALANKIKLMKVKGSSVGLKTIPTTSRTYFLVAPPIGLSTQSKARSFFVDKTWSCGKAIDFLSKKLNAENTNNNPEGPQLRLFTSEGEIITEDLGVTILNLLENNTLVDGDNLILEYITLEEIASDSNIFVENRSLEKYTFI